MVADNEAPVVTFQLIEGPITHSLNILIEGVGLGVKLQTQYPVAQIDKRGTGVLCDYPSRFLVFCKREEMRIGREGLIGACRKIPVQGAVALLLVKALRPGIDHFLDPGCNRKALGLHTGNGILNPQGIPELEWPQFMGKPGPNRIVDGKEGIGDLGYEMGAIGEGERCFMPDELSETVLL